MAINDLPKVSPLSVFKRVEESETPDANETPFREEIFEILRNERRRCTLFYLSQQGDRTVPLGEVVDYVAAWQYEKPVGQVAAKERMCVYSALHQTHLPKLDKAELIDYDRRRNQVTLRDGADYARLYLEYDPSNDLAWSRYYLGITAVAGGLVGMHLIGLYPFTGVDSTILAAVIVLMLALSVVFHEYHDRVNRVSMRELYQADEVQ